MERILVIIDKLNTRIYSDNPDNNNVMIFDKDLLGCTINPDTKRYYTNEELDTIENMLRCELKTQDTLRIGE